MKNSQILCLLRGRNRKTTRASKTRVGTSWTTFYFELRARVGGFEESQYQAILGVKRHFSQLRTGCRRHCWH